MSQQKRSVSALLSDDDEPTITCPLTCSFHRKSRAISGIINEESEGSTSTTHTHDRRMVPCNCPKCNRELVDIRTKIAHEIKQDSDNEQDSEVIQEGNNPLSSLEDNPISFDEDSDNDRSEIQ
jgi:hypothetical protein